MTDFWSGWVILLAVFTLGCFAVPFHLWIAGRHPDAARRHQRTRVGARRVARRCAESSGLVDRDLGDRLPRRLRLPRALSWLRCVQGRSRLDRARRARARPGVNRRARRDRCGSASAARRSKRSPPTPRRCALARCCSSRTARRATAETRDGNVALGAPDLTDGDWLYGGDGQGDPDEHPGRAPRRNARVSAPPFPTIRSSTSPTTSPSLSGIPNDSLRAQLGKPLFSNCVPCHGADGKGNPALGAPNLTDAVWLYGGDRPATIAETISGAATA